MSNSSSDNDRIVWWQRPLYGFLGLSLKAIAFLPLRILYILSDILYIVAYYIIGYRKRVARENIRLSFPQYSDKQIEKVMREFYRNLTDIFVETVKLLHITDEEMIHRMEFVNTEIIDRLLEEGRSICLYFSHCGNWEWAPSVTLWSKYILNNPEIIGGQVYRPLRNKWFDKWYLGLRSRFGTISFPKRTVFRDLIIARREGKMSVVGFMSDQKPSHGDPTFVTTFLNHPTAMITGTETVARKLNMAAVYWDMEKISRGHYRVTNRLIEEHPDKLPPMELTARYTHMLQTTIERQPSIWLWTHKRWKNRVTLPSTPYGSENCIPTESSEK